MSVAVLAFLVTRIGTSSPTLSLPAEVKASLVGLSLRNTGADDWTDVEITIRSGAGATAYRHRLPTVEGRANETIPLIDFADLGGRRWDRLALKIHHVTITGKIRGLKAETMLFFDR